MGDVRHDDEHVQPVLEREVLRAGERRARREETLDGRVLRLVQEHDAALERGRRGEAIEEGSRLALGDPDRDEDDGEGLVMGCARVLDDCGGQLEPRQPGAGEDGELLAADEGVQPVDGRDAGLDEVPRRLPANGVDGETPHGANRFAERRRLPVARSSGAAQHAPEEVLPHDDLGGRAG